MRHGSLFSGIGGFELAAKWAGFTNVFSCEIEEFNQRVLKYHFPESTLHENVKEFNATQYRGRVDLITGGFPCQPYSAAGKRLGKADDRHLWPEMLRIIQEVQPRYVVGENVRGLLNWNGGLVFDEVQTDLENIGYEVTPYLLPACGVNAPHRRDRIWFVANANDNGDRRNARKYEGESGKERVCQRHEIQQLVESGEVQWDATHTSSKRPSKPMADGKLEGGLRPTECSERPTWDTFPTQSPICGGNDGLPTKLDGITFSKWRKESIKSYGNAIVPQVAYEIFKAIKETEKRLSSL